MTVRHRVFWRTIFRARRADTGNGSDPLLFYYRPLLGEIQRDYTLMHRRSLMYLAVGAMAIITLQRTCSHHLSVLRRAGLMRDRRGADTRWAYYTLAPEAVSMLRAHFCTPLDLAAFDARRADCQ